MMRFVDRASVTAPTSLTTADGPGESELNEARKYYGGPGVQPKKAFAFQAYKVEDVKTALCKLFHGKCAYCETVYQASQPVDVEHYRPKAGVEEQPTHPGYWWLAMRWDNLLPSCIDCNRRRHHNIAKSGMTVKELEDELF